ncbi:DUF2785 domain-containing protein [Solibacillus daqui]|uniref:DUF2785 domain-containing protein n=1 Tax=Solibacillus daqui TaxID=2912187 RepID=UPI002366A7AD|nr:DUF2785 domain-containing protein [Solibacillus daqui]
MYAEEYYQIFELSIEARKQYIEKHPLVMKHVLQNVGHDQAKLRDQLNYRLFIQLLSENVLSKTTIHDFVDELSTIKGLVFNIGEKQTNSVFLRSYAALFLAAIVNADRQLQYLTDEQFELITQNAISLLAKEQDLRSFVSAEHGWAHSIANCSELLCAIIQHPKFQIRHTAQILQAIRTNIWKGYVFQDDEEERFCNIIEALLSKGIDEELFIEWIEQLFDRLQMVAYEQGYDAIWFKARTNQLNIAKTLYFYLKFANRNDKLRGIVSIFIQRWIKLN